MAAKRKGLGRGLDALLGGPAKTVTDGADIALLSDDAAGQGSGQLMEIPVEWIQRGKYQPRRDMNPDALQELADSIQSQGVMQPIVVRPIADSRYEIIAGERRWRATQLAGLDKVPCVIKDVADEAAIAMALIENIQREDLNPMEEALALKRLQDEFELTQQEVAEAVGKSRTTITNLLRLIGLHDEVKTLLERGDIEMGHAKALLGLKDGHQREAARQVVAKGLTVRQTEALVRKLQVEETITSPQTDNGNDVKKLEEALSECVGSPVAIQYNNKGKGKLTISYSSLDELDGVLQKLGYSE